MLVKTIKVMFELLTLSLVRPKKKNVMFVVTRPTHFKPPDRNVFMSPFVSIHGSAHASCDGPASV